MPSTEEMLTIDPRPAAFIVGTTACTPRNTPVRLTAMTASHLASG